MTARPEVLAVHRAAHDEPCGRCRGTIVRGRRTALLAGIGAVHLACIIARYDTQETNAAVTRPPSNLNRRPPLSATSARRRSGKGPTGLPQPGRNRDR